MKKLSTFFLLYFSFILSVSAASLCSYKDQVTLNQKAANIKFNAAMDKKTEMLPEGPFEVDYYKINILNLTEEFYAVMVNNRTKEEYRFEYTDAVDGVVTFEWDDFTYVNDFMIRIYSSNKTGCPDEVYKSYMITIPRYNLYSRVATCADVPEFSLCQKYVTFEEGSVTWADFESKIDNYVAGKADKNGNKLPEEPKEKSGIQKFLDFLNKYKWIIIIVILIGGGTIGGAIYYKKQKELKKIRELGL